jgi:plasmid stabilization system protein ParE
VRVIIGGAAEVDLIRIYEFNLARSPAWADRVEQRLLERADALPNAPLAGRRVTMDGIRRVSVSDIQYVLDYRIGDEEIEVLRFQSSREIR